jgi:hypothetical protein
MFGPADSAVGRVTRTRAQGTGSADDVEREPILSSRRPHCCHGHARLSRERTNLPPRVRACWAKPVLISRPYCSTTAVRASPESAGVVEYAVGGVEDERSPRRPLLEVVRPGQPRCDVHEYLADLRGVEHRDSGINCCTSALIPRSVHEAVSPDFQAGHASSILVTRSMA